MLKRRVLLCADDYALHSLVDEAVVRLTLQGRLSATSCMTTAPRWPQAAQPLLALRPRLALGLHFNLTEGHGVQAGSGIGAILAKAYSGQLAPQAMRGQWQRQLDAFEDALGTAPDFIDGHQHVHQLPGVRAALLDELQHRYASRGQPVPWVRSTSPAGRLWLAPKAGIIGLLGGWRMTGLLRARGVPHNHGFGGVYGFDAPHVSVYDRHMRRWLAQVPDGGLLMCHPATSPVPGDAIGEARALEFAYLSSDAFAHALAAQGSEVVQGNLRELLSAA